MNEIEKLSEMLSKGKPLNLFFRITCVISSLAGLLAMFLPFGQIMYYHPQGFSMLNLSAYDVNNLLVLFSTVVGMFANLVVVASLSWIEKGQAKKAVCAHILTSAFSLIALCIYTLNGEMALYGVESYCDMRVDASIGFFAPYVCIFIPLVLSAISAIIISLISSGKVTVEQMFGKR